ncbi:MAG: radical SAM protein [Candidatus Aminicenantes bacterium]|nr:radical SAM protein [Candidatus Aminicenantes bacterium]NIM79487.1 radical SAM protein [Candidatus Aminicenantes bacterium]NIN18773.1 radical SAM protein [Candidatus Aminicenantes bacterium]NIN42695.1 radical SAM protein [Candidatus Aminicenantes bacterium]NIN85429.1 radical SAM protein [Candidatus Aminicenantes bacterium]
MKKLKKFFNRLFSSASLPAHSRIFDVEASRRCNISCKFCPRENMKKIGMMEPGTFDNFLKNARLRSHDTVTFCGLGEPLLNPSLPGFVTQLRNRYHHFNIGIITNGTLLNPHTVTSLLDAQINSIMVSFNGIDAQTYENLTKGARFTDTLAKLEYTQGEILKRKNPGTRGTQLLVTFILSRENLHLEEKIKAFWYAKGMRSVPQYMHNRGGFVDINGIGMSPVYSGEPAGAPVQSCAVFENFNFIAWNGDVLVCCQDIQHRFVVGNINKDSMSLIHSRKAQIIKENKWPDICRNCTEPNRLQPADDTGTYI